MEIVLNASLAGGVAVGQHVILLQNFEAMLVCHSYYIFSWLRLLF